MKSRPLVVFNVQQENKHILELQQENRELRDLLEEHQSVLERIMSKYRQQITQLVHTSSKENSKDYTYCSQVNIILYYIISLLCSVTFLNAF